MLYLGGPLTFLPQLKKSFDKALGVTGTCPENSLYFVALGAALYSDKMCIRDSAGPGGYGTGEQRQHPSARGGGRHAAAFSAAGFSGLCSGCLLYTSDVYKRQVPTGDNSTLENFEETDG